jgi:hypothetical protein
MRRRDLIKRLKDDHNRLRAVNDSGAFSSGTVMAQHKTERRLALLHGLETLLPEIIEKMEQAS